MVGFGDLRAAEAATMRAFDAALFVQHLRDNALPPYGVGRCATYVREAMETAGLSAVSRPRLAKDYGPWLRARGFREIPSKGYKPRLGDIAVFQGLSPGAAGHIQGWDGTHWISDFVQPGFWPGSRYKAAEVPFVLYRR